MHREVLHTDPHVPFFTTIALQVLSVFGFVALMDGSARWFKAFLSLVGCSLISFVPGQIWSVLFFRHLAPGKDQDQLFGFLSLKRRDRLRLLLASVLAYLSVLSYFQAGGSSVVGNVTVFSISRFFVAILSKSLKSSQLGRILCFIFFFCSVSIITVATGMRVGFVLLSAVSLWLCLQYLFLLVPAFHTEVSAVRSVLVLATLIALPFALVFEGFRADVKWPHAIVGGLLVWSPPHFLSLLKKSGTNPWAAQWCVCLAFALSLSMAYFQLKTTETPLSFYLAVALAFLGTRSISFSVTESVVIKPFSTAKSAIHFLVSILAVFGAASQAFTGISRGECWRIADAIYLVVILKWTLSEVLNVIQQSSTPRFSYGYRRVSHILAFTLSVFAFFSVLRVSVTFFKPTVPISKSAQLSKVALPIHIVIVLFFLWSPRGAAQQRPPSIIGALNFHSASKQPPDRSASRDYADPLALILTLLGPFAGSAFLDRLVAVLVLAIVAYLALPLLRDSISVLMQAVPRHIGDQVKAISGELSRELTGLHIWQNDAALAVGTVSICIDAQVHPKPQDFLMYVISTCQRAGILDVTVEVANRAGAAPQGARPLPGVRSAPSPL
jgi:divalent metal cation (Fe/Co/Zn/Cd) transporter